VSGGGFGVKAKGSQGGEDFEAERWLVAYLQHVESLPKATRSADEPIVLVLPDAQVVDRRKRGERQASSLAGGGKKSAG
jgi:hypothetical protein